MCYLLSTTIVDLFNSCIGYCKIIMNSIILAKSSGANISVALLEKAMVYDSSNGWVILVQQNQ